MRAHESDICIDKQSKDGMSGERGGEGGVKEKISRFSGFDTPSSSKFVKNYSKVRTLIYMIVLFSYLSQIGNY